MPYPAKWAAPSNCPLNENETGVKSLPGSRTLLPPVRLEEPAFPHATSREFVEPKRTPETKENS